MKYKVTDVGSNVIGEIVGPIDGLWAAKYHGDTLSESFTSQDNAEAAVRKAHQAVLDKGARPA